MAAKLKLMIGRQLSQQVFDVAAHQVLRDAALHAQQMVMVAAMAQLIVQVAVLQQNPAKYTGLHQELERAVYGGAPKFRQPFPQCFSGEMALLGGDGVGYRLPRQRGPVPFSLKGVQQLLSQR